MTDYTTDESILRDTIPGFRTEITNRSDTILPLSQSVIHHPIHWYNPWDIRYNLNRLWSYICSRFVHLVSATGRLTRRQIKLLLRELYNTLINTPQAILMVLIYTLFVFLVISVWLGKHLNVKPLLDTEHISLKPATVSAYPDPAPPNDDEIARYCERQRTLDPKIHKLTEAHHRIVRVRGDVSCACQLNGFITPDKHPNGSIAPLGSPRLRILFNNPFHRSFSETDPLFSVDSNHLISRIRSPDSPRHFLLEVLDIDWKQRLTEIRDMIYGLMGWGSMMSFNYWLLWASIRIADLAEEAARSMPVSAQLLAINETYSYPSWVAGLGIRTHVD
jgi:hypothetical protein